MNEFQKEVVAENAEKKQLLWALRTRILTEAEMSRVAEFGIKIFVQLRYSEHAAWGAPYRETDLEKRLNECLLQQFRMRSIAEGAKADGSKE